MILFVDHTQTLKLADAWAALQLTLRAMARRRAPPGAGALARPAEALAQAWADAAGPDDMGQAPAPAVLPLTVAAVDGNGASTAVAASVGPATGRTAAG